MSRLLEPSAALETFVTRTMSPETPVQQRLRHETARLEQAMMQIGADQGHFMAMLLRLLGARRVIEIGTFTGYSALAMAAALPDDGKLICCDVSEEWTSIGRRHWEEAGLSDKIELRLAPATETIAALLRDGAAGTFDFAFIDADKPGYDGYYEACLDLLRPGGLIALDNMLWSGRVADESDQEETTKLLRALNLKIRDDARVEASLLTIGDGVLLARKR